MRNSQWMCDCFMVMIPFPLPAHDTDLKEHSAALLVGSFYYMTCGLCMICNKPFYVKMFGLFCTMQYKQD